MKTRNNGWWEGVVVLAAAFVLTAVLWAAGPPQLPPRNAVAAGRADTGNANSTVWRTSRNRS